MKKIKDNGQFYCHTDIPLEPYIDFKTLPENVVYEEGKTTYKDGSSTSYATINSGESTGSIDCGENVKEESSAVPPYPDPYACGEDLNNKLREDFEKRLKEFFLNNHLADDLYACREDLDEKLKKSDNKKSSNVDHPDHYKSGNIECIDAMLEIYGISATYDFCLLNAFKYIWRAQQKGKEKEDIQKAVWYLNKALEIQWS